MGEQMTYLIPHQVVRLPVICIGVLGQFVTVLVIVPEPEPVLGEAAPPAIFHALPALIIWKIQLFITAGPTLGSALPPPPRFWMLMEQHGLEERQEGTADFFLNL